jgi:hypothetical protein
MNLAQGDEVPQIITRRTRQRPSELLTPPAGIVIQTCQVRKVPILLQKSFWGGERKFLEPLMRFTRGNVRDHIVSSKIDHGPPQWR